MEKLMIDKKKKKCLGIFSLLSATTNVQDYVFFLLKSLRYQVDELVIFCNELIYTNEYERLKKNASEIFICNGSVVSSNDIRECCKLENLKKYDQILWFDDSFYGPVYQLDDMFKKMNSFDVDFWGITYNGKMLNDERRCLPASLHSYFIMLNSKVICDDKFKTFYNSNVENFAEGLVNMLVLGGFSWKSYIELDQYISDDASKNIDISLLLSYELVKKHCCPFVRRDSFVNFELINNSGENARNLLEFIEKVTEYNADMIWNDLLQRYNVLDIKNVLQLDYVLPHNLFSGDKSIIEGKKIAVIIHLHYWDLVDDCFEYIKKIPSNIDVYITTSNDKTKGKIQSNIAMFNLENCRIVDKENRGRDVSALLVACKDLLMNYEYLCFNHDKKSSAYLNTITEGKSFMYNMWENTLKNSDYIFNVIKCFEDNKRLGLIVPPEPFHGTYIGTLGNEWTNNYDNVVKLAQRLNINCNLDEEKPTFTLGTTFWCRTSALEPLFVHGFEYSDFQDEPMDIDGTISHAIERIIPYVAQSNGYYSANVMHSDYASLRMVGLQSILIETLNILKNEAFLSNVFDIRKFYEKAEKLREFCNMHKKIYIYGAGMYGDACYKAMIKNNLSFNGYIVSDNQKQKSYLNDHNVYELSEIQDDPKECGVILALNSKNQKEVYPILMQKGFLNLYYLT